MKLAEKTSPDPILGVAAEDRIALEEKQAAACGF